jgi:hypothetical protein
MIFMGPYTITYINAAPQARASLRELRIKDGGLR